MLHSSMLKIVKKKKKKDLTIRRLWNLFCTFVEIIPMSVVTGGKISYHFIVL